MLSGDGPIEGLGRAVVVGPADGGPPVGPQLAALLRENLNLIARKMVERTGHSGEHYIAHNRPEYWHMWRAALGGGLLTVITAAIKMRISTPICLPSSKASPAAPTTRSASSFFRC